MSRKTLLASFTLLVSLAAAGFWYLRQPKPVALVPTLTGQVEYCLTCHSDLPEISPSHPIKTFGCVICHGGERLALDADLAHSTMRGGRNPSELSVVEASCGGASCHSGSLEDERDHIQRVMSSLQGTYAGAIANMRYSYGAQPDLTAQQGIYAVQNANYHAGDPGVAALVAFNPPADSNPSILKFATNCLVCHLSAPAPNAPEITSSVLPATGARTLPEFARLSGCAACHTPTAGSDLNRSLHQLTTAIPYTQCNTCHNRGNYDLRSMQFVPRSDQPTNRLDDYYQPIAQFTRCEWTLDCIDCHTRTQAMGDGYIHNNQKEAQDTRCSTCHGTPAQLPLTHTIEDSSDLALRLVFLNPVIDLKVGDTILVTENGQPLWNTRLLPDGTYELYGKATGQRFTFRPVMGSGCTQDPSRQDSNYCHTCHAVER